MNLPLQKTHI